MQIFVYLFFNREINEIAEKNANYTIKHIDELPKEYQCEELYQKLALSLYQKHRPKWCPDYIWKYHNNPR